MLLDGLAEVASIHLVAVPPEPPAPADVEGARRCCENITVLPAPIPPLRTARKLLRWMALRSDVVGRRLPAAARRAAARVAAGWNPDVTVVDSSLVGPLATWPGPLVLHLHNVESLVLRSARRTAAGPCARLSATVEETLVRRLERRLIRHSTLVIAASDDDGAEVRRLVPDAPVAVVPNAVDTERVPLLPPRPPASTRPTVLFVGSFGYPPNCDAASELVDHWMPAIRGRHPGARPVLAGGGLPAAAAARLVAAGARVLGRVPDLLSIYRDADVVAVPIRSGGGTRIKILEALAAGRPVVTTRKGAEGLPVTDGVHVLMAESPGEAAAAVARLLHDDGLAERLRREGRILVTSRFSRAAAVAAFAAAFDRFRGISDGGSANPAAEHGSPA